LKEERRANVTVLLCGKKGTHSTPFCGQKSPPPVSGCFRIHHGRQPFQYFADGTILPLSIEKSKPLSILKLHFFEFSESTALNNSKRL